MKRLDAPYRGEDITGQRFGTRVVLGRAPRTSPAKKRWFVRCMLCGHETDVDERVLKSGFKCRKCWEPGLRWEMYCKLRAHGLNDAEIESLEIGSPVTLDNLLAKADAGHGKLPLFVHLVDPKGHALVRVKEVQVDKKRVLLIVDLPRSIESWKRR